MVTQKQEFFEQLRKRRALKKIKYNEKYPQTSITGFHINFKYRNKKFIIKDFLGIRQRKNHFFYQLIYDSSS